MPFLTKFVAMSKICLFYLFSVFVVEKKQFAGDIEVFLKK